MVASCAADTATGSWSCTHGESRPSKSNLEAPSSEVDKNEAEPALPERPETDVQKVRAGEQLRQDTNVSGCGGHRRTRLRRHRSRLPARSPSSGPGRLAWWSLGDGRHEVGDDLRAPL